MIYNLAFLLTQLVSPFVYIVLVQCSGCTHDYPCAQYVSIKSRGTCTCSHYAEIIGDFRSSAHAQLQSALFCAVSAVH